MEKITVRININGARYLCALWGPFLHMWNIVLLLGYNITEGYLFIGPLPTGSGSIRFRRVSLNMCVCGWVGVTNRG